MKLLTPGEHAGLEGRRGSKYDGGFLLRWAVGRGEEGSVRGRRGALRLRWRRADRIESSPD